MREKLARRGLCAGGEGREREYDNDDEDDALAELGMDDEPDGEEGNEGTGGRVGRFRGEATTTVDVFESSDILLRVEPPIVVVGLLLLSVVFDRGLPRDSANGRENSGRGSFSGTVSSGYRFRRELG